MEKTFRTSADAMAKSVEGKPVAKRVPLDRSAGVVVDKQVDDDLVYGEVMIILGDARGNEARIRTRLEELRQAGLLL